MAYSRRSLLKQLAGGAAFLGIGGPALDAARLIGNDLKGNINHSVSRWTYGNYELDELCQHAKAIGIGSVELLDPDEFQTVLDHGLTCAMVNAPGTIEEGFNDPNNHDQLIPAYEERIPKVAEAGFPNLICFSGNRNGISDEEGIENCFRGIEPFIGLAEQHDVTICMEYLNSIHNHPDYHFDYMDFGVEVANRIGSDHFKLLYDIYHVQIMEGDLIHKIREHSDLIAHYHTGGVPGRNEIDETQEIYYPAVMEAIVETGFDGWVGQEFVPTWDDDLAALERAVEICDV